MKRWSKAKNDYVESERIYAFLTEIAAVCVKHRLSISHEDGHGAFEVANLDVFNIEWLNQAHVSREVEV